MSKNNFGDILIWIFVFFVVSLFVSVMVSMIAYVEYQKHPDYGNSEIFAQGQMQKSTDCYGITTVKIGGRIVDSIVTMPFSGSWMNINLSDLCPDQDFTIYRKNFWVLGNAYTIK